MSRYRNIYFLYDPIAKKYLGYNSHKVTFAESLPTCLMSASYEELEKFLSDKIKYPPYYSLDPKMEKFHYDKAEIHEFELVCNKVHKMTKFVKETIKNKKKEAEEKALYRKLKQKYNPEEYDPHPSDPGVGAFILGEKECLQTI